MVSVKWIFLVLLAFTWAVCFSWASSSVVGHQILRGVTIQSKPFIQTDNNRFTGFCVDLMDEIKSLTNLNYSLYLVEDGEYGRVGINTPPNGMIADLVVHKKADFAIADITVTAGRAQYVQFTRPFFVFSVSALVHRRHAQGLHTLDDLAHKRPNMTIGVYPNGSTMKMMRRLRDHINTIGLLYSRIPFRHQGLSPSIKPDQMLAKVYQEPFAFLQQEPLNAYLAKQDCEQLVSLPDPNLYLRGEYAIALPPGSPFVELFNDSIRVLEQNGRLAKLRRQYFGSLKSGNQCRGSEALRSSSGDDGSFGSIAMQGSVFSSCLLVCFILSFKW